MLFRHKWESNELALLRRDLGRWTVDSVDIFYKLLGIATTVYCKGTGYLRGKVFFYTQKKIASREKKTTSERIYIGLGRHEDSVCPVEDPPLGLRFEDVDGGLFGGRVQGVPRCDG